MGESRLVKEVVGAPSATSVSIRGLSSSTSGSGTPSTLALLVSWLASRILLGSFPSSLLDLLSGRFLGLMSFAEASFRGVFSLSYRSRLGQSLCSIAEFTQAVSRPVASCSLGGGFSCPVCFSG